MPADRTQLTTERIDALVEVLADANLIDEATRADLQEVEEIGEAHQIAEDALGVDL